MMWRVPAIALLCLALSSCDAWPMEFHNDSRDSIKFQYLHKDYAEWSVDIPFPPGGDALLDREHYFKDVRGLRVKDSNRLYQANPTALASFHNVCDSAASCTLTYLGNGQLRVSRGSRMADEATQTPR